MPRGGARPNAGRKKAKELRKPICWRLTEDERKYLRKQLDKYRQKTRGETKMLLRVEGKEFEGKTQAECLKELLEQDTSISSSKVLECFAKQLSEYDRYDEDGEIINEPYTDEYLIEAFDRATQQNFVKVEWAEK